MSHGGDGSVVSTSASVARSMSDYQYSADAFPLHPWSPLKFQGWTLEIAKKTDFEGWFSISKRSSFIWQVLFTYLWRGGKQFRFPTLRNLTEKPRYFSSTGATPVSWYMDVDDKEPSKKVHASWSQRRRQGPTVPPTISLHNLGLTVWLQQT